MEEYPRLLHTAIDTTRPRELAEFYRQLLGLQYRAGDEPPPDGAPDEADWLVLVDSDGVRKLAFQGVDELTRTTSGNIFIRYLPAGAKVGDPRARYLTIATYPYPDANPEVTKAANRAATSKLAKSIIGVEAGGYPKSIHVAYPGVNYQVEVFDPSPSAGRKLVASGAISPLP